MRTFKNLEKFLEKQVATLTILTYDKVLILNQKSITLIKLFVILKFFLNIF